MPTKTQQMGFYIYLPGVSSCRFPWTRPVFLYILLYSPYIFFYANLCSYDLVLSAGTRRMQGRKDRLCYPVDESIHGSYPQTE